MALNKNSDLAKAVSENRILLTLNRPIYFEHKLQVQKGFGSFDFANATGNSGKVGLWWFAYSLIHLYSDAGLDSYSLSSILVSLY